MQPTNAEKQRIEDMKARENTAKAIKYVQDLYWSLELGNEENPDIAADSIRRTLSNHDLTFKDALKDEKRLKGLTSKQLEARMDKAVDATFVNIARGKLDKLLHGEADKRFTLGAQIENLRSDMTKGNVRSYKQLLARDDNRTDEEVERDIYKAVRDKELKDFQKKNEGKRDRDTEDNVSISESVMQQALAALGDTSKLRIPHAVAPVSDGRSIA